MEQLLEYTFKELQASRQMFASATKALQRQKSFNHRITLASLIMAGCIGILYKKNEELKADISKLREKGE